ncbi:hypothetical protein [Stenotrophomonas sp.]|uniref:hypothetical protein n=1 Tax=Stenotrophomonas sp. TaxID=69392 RepID=UPI0028B1A472|nr:hypothetical protein [Stenotrophomonas sp.]
MIKSNPLNAPPFEPNSPQFVWKTRFKDKCVYTGCGVGLPGRIESDQQAEIHATKQALAAQLAHVRLSQCHEVFIRNTTAALITVHHLLSQAAEKDAVFFLCADAEVAGQIITTLNIQDMPS